MSTIEKAFDKLRKGHTPSTEREHKLDDAAVHPHPEHERVRPTSQMVELNPRRLNEIGLLTPDQGRSQVAEEFRAIKRPLLKNAFGQSSGMIDNRNLIMVTSAMPGEGKTFTSINLALSIAMEMDRTALLVDADVARPFALQYLGINAEKGLVDYLLNDDLKLSDILLKTNIPKFSVLPAGSAHQHATELLASENMVRLMSELSERYQDRVIIFDSPPLLLTSESRVLSSHMGQIVIVVEAEKTDETMLNTALGLLDTDKFIGLVLNKNRRAGKEYGYAYGSYYGASS